MTLNIIPTYRSWNLIEMGKRSPTGTIPNYGNPPPQKKSVILLILGHSPVVIVAQALREGEEYLAFIHMQVTLHPDRQPGDSDIRDGGKRWSMQEAVPKQKG